MKTSTLILIAFNVILILFAGSSFKIFQSFSEIQEQVQDASDITSRVLESNFALSQSIKDIKFDVVQVQQWLQDLSSTRGLDGLDDGKEKAKEFADLFEKDAENAKKIAANLKLDDIVSAITSVEKEFPAYFEVGNRMTDAYVEGGPALGNKMMPEFDAASEKMQGEIDKLTQLVGAATTASKNNVVSKLADTKNNANATLNILIVILSVTFCMAAAAAAAVFILIKRRSKAMEKLANIFEDSVQKLSHQLSEQAEDLLKKAAEMRDSMRELNDKAASTSHASNEASSNIEFVASATEELTSSVYEIRSQITKSNTVIEESNAIMGRAEMASDSLGIAVHSISQALGMIEGLAGQINMLSMNATIESARAGEAGKGFAVVAGEVKNLAVETTKSTGLIADKIAEVKETSESVLNVLTALKQSLVSVSEYAHSIGSAVNQQGSATEEIAHRMVSVSDHTKDVDENLLNVSRISENNHQVSLTVLATAEALNNQSVQLDKDVREFLKDIRKMA